MREKNRAEVLRKSIFVYDQEKHIKHEKMKIARKKKLLGREKICLNNKIWFNAHNTLNVKKNLYV